MVLDPARQPQSGGSSACGTVLARVSDAFQVRPGEGRRVAILAVYSAAAVGGILTVGNEGVAVALFVGRLPTAAMPLTLILPGAAIVIALLIYNRLVAHIRLVNVVIASAFVLACAGVCLRLLLAIGYGNDIFVLAAVFLFCEIAASLTIVQFWTIAGQVFSAREARRLFTLITAGGMLSVVAAGLSLAALTEVIGVENLLYVVVASLVACGACAAALARDIAAPAAARARREAGRGSSATVVDDIRAILRSPLLRTLGCMFIVLSLTINIAFYQYVLGLQAVYSGRDEALAVFLGGFAWWTGLAALIVQLVVASRVMVRWGAFVGLLFLPVATAAAAAVGIASSGALWAVVLARAADPVLRRTINEPAINALCLPVPSDVRRQVMTMFEGAYAFTFALAGIGFVLMQRVPDWTYERWSWPLLGLGACWIGLLVPARRQYRQAVADAIRRRRLSFEGVKFDLDDNATSRLLVDALRSADEARVTYGLELLAKAPPGGWTPHVVSLLSHPATQIRLHALSIVARNGNRADAPAVAPLLEAVEPAVRAAALAVYRALDEASASRRSEVLLGDSCADVRAASAGVLLASADPRWLTDAASECERLLRSHDPASRRAAARLLDDILANDIEPDVLSFLSVDGARLRTRRQRDEAILGRLVGMVDDPACWEVAVEALAHHGARSVSSLARALSDRGQPRAVRLRIVRAAQRINGEAICQLLVGYLDEPDGILRSAVCQALAHLRTSGAGGPIDEATIRSRILAELHDIYELHIARADLAAAFPMSLIATALGERIADGLERILFLLEASFPERGVAHARLALDAPGPTGRALAIELLEAVVHDRVRCLLVPVLEGMSDRIIAIGRLQFGLQRRSSEQRLEQFATCPDPWLQACAIYEAGQRGMSRLAASVQAALDSEDAVVREAALEARRQLADKVQVLPLTTARTGQPDRALDRGYAVARSH